MTATLDKLDLGRGSKGISEKLARLRLFLVAPAIRPRIAGRLGLVYTLNRDSGLLDQSNAESRRTVMCQDDWDFPTSARTTRRTFDDDCSDFDDGDEDGGDDDLPDFDDSAREDP